MRLNRRSAKRIFCVIAALLLMPSIEAKSDGLPWNNDSGEYADTPAGRALERIQNWVDNGNEDQVNIDDSFASRFRSNMRLSLDLATRVVMVTNGGSTTPVTVNFIGLDMYKVFTDDDGDWGTAILQGYVTKLHNAGKRPPFFEGPHDWEFVNRIMNLNITKFHDNKLNYKIGHFEVPYGLEQPINTNGTLYDMTHPRNLGVKADWGVTANGVLDRLDYEIGLSRGTGNEYFDRGNPYVFAGRVGTPRDENFIVGVSYFDGRVANPGAVGMYKSGLVDASGINLNGVMTRQRYGLDFQYHMEKPITFMAELNWGRDIDQDVFNALFEVDIFNHSKSTMFFNQLSYYSQEFEAAKGGWENDISFLTGIRYTPTTRWAISLAYSQDVSGMNKGAATGPRLGSKFLVQARYRF